ncbi:uncharacterized protein C8Q71DRAFT_61451 [Rhodofomes roseus]|uniref:Secreted protein n=1 Tax=Rhodofomes roseus TaxID=34475 RepID=A0ABQ8KGB2_9APHY|nr:uncharacterized protein C8Q71DRAFT_61451 [Rhodofomes roseus]KAH9836818.1 hypothetical protein C8Q71DRAFT_61451 [Rhodofomes roseus]
MFCINHDWLSIAEAVCLWMPFAPAEGQSPWQAYADSVAQGKRICRPTKCTVIYFTVCYEVYHLLWHFAGDRNCGLVPSRTLRRGRVCGGRLSQSTSVDSVHYRAQHSVLSGDIENDAKHTMHVVRCISFHTRAILLPHAGIIISPHVRMAVMPPKKTTSPVRILMFPGSFSGAQTSSRMNAESLDSFGSWRAPRRAGGAECRATGHG